MLTYKRLLLPALLAVLALFATASIVSAEAIPVFATPAFATLAERLSDKVGVPLTDEFGTPEGTMQITSTGALYWHEKTGTLAFTDGWEHAALVNDQPVIWHGESADPPPVAVISATPVAYASNARVKCIENHESGGANIWNKQGSGAGGVMQYFPSTFQRGANEMGHPEWSLWVPWQAEAVAAHDLAMGRRSQWAVSGC